MEKPYSGRAIISEDFSEVKIIIPVKFNWKLLTAPIVVFAAVLMLGPGNMILAMLVTPPGNLFEWLLRILIVGAIGHLIVSTWWLINGKEVITVGNGVISIKREGDLFSRSNSYDLTDANYFRSEETQVGQWQNGKYRRDYFPKLSLF